MVAVDLALFMALVSVCSLPGGSGLALALEVVLLGVASSWIVRFLAGAVATYRLSRSLRCRWVPASIQGIECRVIADPTVQAFALGLLRPRVYITGRMTHALDPDGQRAVLLHEDHHRHTRAPLRALAIDSFADTVGRIPAIRDALERRLARLEEDADRHALGQGAHRSALARALIAIDAADSGTAFAGYAGSRIKALLDPAGMTVSRTGSLPIEWLGMGVILVTAAFCLV